MNKFLHARVFRFAMLIAIVFLAITADAATIAVVNTNDALAGSLRQAIQDANPGDTIIFQIPTTDPGYEATRAIYTINLSASASDANSALVIAKNLTIDGGNSRIIVARGAAGTTQQFRVFNVSAGTVAASADCYQHRRAESLAGYRSRYQGLSRRDNPGQSLGTAEGRQRCHQGSGDLEVG
jgi:hypothetical protein